MQTLRGFITRHGIKMTAELVYQRPDKLMDDMPTGSTHWKCRLTCHGRAFTLYFSQGPAISKEPTAEDILSCVISDATGFQNARSFEDWCSEYGYSEDSRKAEKIYHACENQAKRLERFIPDGYLYDLLYQTEPL